MLRVSYPTAAPPVRSVDPVDPTAAPLTPLEPNYATLPLVDPLAEKLPPYPPLKGITEATVLRLAANRAASADALDQENARPSTTLEGANGHQAPSDDLFRDLRQFIAADFRNRAAGEAASLMYQLADAEGRGDLIRQSIESLDTLRAAVKAAKAKGGMLPISEDDLDAQRATLIGVAGQAELGAKLLDAELKRRLGVSAHAAERFQPSGDFAVPSDAIDAEAAVRVALEKRHDLIALRTAHLKLSPATLDSVREYLRGLPAGGGLLGGTGPQLPIFSRIALRKQQEALDALHAVSAVEVELRRQQLFLLIAEKERGVADEVRAQVAIMTEQVHQIGIARWRAEKAVAKLADVKKQDKGPAVEVPLQLEANKARAEVLQGVMLWHQARVKLAAAQGLYGDPNETVPASPMPLPKPLPNTSR